MLETLQKYFWTECCPVYLDKISTRIQGAGVAQSEQCLTTDWTAGVRSPTEAENFSL
jgi:hypothetical protein